MAFPEELLGPRIETSWMEVLSYPEGKVLGVVNHVSPDSVQIDFNVDSRIMGGMKFTWNPPSSQRTPDFDWNRVLFRPWTRINMMQWPWGVYIASQVDKSGTSRAVSALDKTSLLDQDAPTSTFSVQAGTNIVEAVKAIFLDRLPYESLQITATTKTVDAMMTWPAGTPYLTIINDLLEKADYSLIRVDGYGSFFSYSNVDPTTLLIQHTFSSGDLSIHAPDPQDTQDFLSVPNQVICTTMGSDTAPALLSVATNDKNDSPYSVTNRGRIISKSYTNVEASDQATLDSIASRNLWNSSTPVRSVVVEYAKVPLFLKQIVMFNDDASTIDHTLFQVNEVSVNLAEGSLVKGRWNMVEEEMGQLVVSVNPDDTQDAPAYMTGTTTILVMDTDDDTATGVYDDEGNLIPSDNGTVTEPSTTTSTTTVVHTGTAGVTAKEVPGTSGHLSTAQIRSLAVQAGFTGQDVELAIAMCMAESGGNPNATNHNTNGSWDKGLWQINDINSDVISRCGGNRFDPLSNAKMAKIIKDRQGWRAWSTYNNGAYKKFLK